VKSTLENFLQLEIETNFTEKISKTKFNVWPFIRNYFAEAFMLNNNPGVKINQISKKKLMKDTFFGNPLNIIKRKEYFIFIYSDQRKKIGDKYYHPFDYLPAYILNEALFIEVPLNMKCSQKDIPSRNKISKNILLATELLISPFISTKKYISKSGIEETQKLLDINYNPSKNIIRLISGYFLMKYLMLRIHKPKAVFCTVPYSIMGYIKALKEKDIPVIELQHGYIGHGHRAYSIPKDYGNEFYPDYFLAWGTKDQKFLQDKTNFYIQNKSNISLVGNFYLDHLLSNKYLQQKLLPYKKIVGNESISISMQDPIEQELLNFLIPLAVSNRKINFIILPRNKSHEYYQKKFKLPKNIYLFPEINTYEGILISKVHTTMWSSTALEAVGLSRPNILINIKGSALKAYKGILGDKEFTYYVENKKEFILSYQRCISLTELELKTASKNICIPNFKERLHKTVEQIIKT